MELDELTRDLFFPKSYFFFEPQTGNRMRRQEILRLFQHFLRTNDIQFTSTHKPGENRTWFVVWCKTTDIRDRVSTVEYTEDLLCDTILLSFYAPTKSVSLIEDRSGWLWWNRENGFMFVRGLPDSSIRGNSGMDFFRKLATKRKR